MRRLIVPFSYFFNNPHQSQLTITCGQLNSRNWSSVRGALITLMSLAFVGISLNPGMLWANTITAASCSRTHVGEAVTSAGDGDVVIIPSCPGGVSWNTKLDITKAITLQGAGIAQTVILDDVTKGTSNCSGVGPLISLNVSANLPWRMTRFTIQGSVTDPYICNVGHIIVGGGSHSFRIDHVAFKNMQTSGISTYGDLWGVIDHNTFTGSHKQGVIIRHNTWGGVGSYGDNSWADASSLGTEKAIFIEDNIFNDDQAQGAGAIDNFAGARVVFRNNQASFLGSHGTESSQRIRGIRQFEIYGNTLTSQTNGDASGFYLRGGTGVFFNNTFLCKNGDCAANPYGRMMIIENDRDRDPFFPWGTCDGTSAFDKNDGVVYASGQHNGPSGANNILTDSTKSWTTDQWNTDYAVRNTTAGWSSVISTNTATSGTTQASIYGKSHAWNSGDGYKILRAYPCIDQVGRGDGSLLSGDSPTPAAWPNQILDPIYQWNNNFIGNKSPVISTSTRHAKVNRDFYNNVPRPEYVPFVYPHPLVTDSGATNPPPTAPSGLSVK